jgi:hypothetical protein
MTICRCVGDMNDEISAGEQSAVRCPTTPAISKHLPRDGDSSKQATALVAKPRLVLLSAMTCPGIATCKAPDPALHEL